jgi:hypothetical protein
MQPRKYSSWTAVRQLDEYQHLSQSRQLRDRPTWWGTKKEDFNDMQDMYVEHGDTFLGYADFRKQWLDSHFITPKEKELRTKFDKFRDTLESDLTLAQLQDAI